MSARESVADLFLRRASVYTMNASRAWADAVAVAGGRIMAVGAEAEISSLVGPRTQVLDLAGCTVLPGFQDAHVHPLHGGLAEARCGLHEIWGRPAYAEAISAYARAHPEDDWIEGAGWAMDAFPGGTPTAAELDELVGDRAAFLVNRDGHGAWVSTAALRRAGITATTPDPRDGRIERYGDGSPTGTLHEGAMDLVASLLPPPTTADLVAALRRAQRRLHSHGITAWNDAWVEPGDLDAYVAFEAAGELSARVVLSLLWERGRGEEQIDDLVAMRERATKGGLVASNAKIFQDGVAENFTAGMIEPYLDAQGRPTANSGLSLVEPEALGRYVTLLDAHGFQVHFHAIGDRAAREALDALEVARTANGARDARHHICHLQVVQRDDIARFRPLGVVANAQALWAYEDAQMRDLTIPFLGAERARLQYPFASLRGSGARLALGSDWPVSSPDPLAQIHVAVTRTPPDHPGEPFLPEQRLDLPAALEAATIGSAYVNKLESETGSIEPGKLADLAVVDRDLFSRDAGRLSDARVLLTMVEGRPVHAVDGLL
jgi:predicted amidohydrolase YtcJ